MVVADEGLLLVEGLQGLWEAAACTPDPGPT